MNWILAAEAAPALGALALGSVLTVRLLSYRSKSDGREYPDEISNFDLAHYEPMNRLLTGSDFEFLSSQPGYRPGIGRRFRRNRRRIFRLYLRELTGEFHQLHAAARKAVAVSPAEHAEFVGALLLQQVVFWRTLFLLELRLIVPWRARVDAAGLVRTVESLHAGLHRVAQTVA